MVVDREYYDILHISPEASEKDIKQAYRTAAIKHHPDKGGDEQKFKEINAAYEVLSNEEKREIYDRYGKSGVDGAGSSMDPHDIFSQFFGNSGFGGFSFDMHNMGHQRTANEDKNTYFELGVSLEDIYNGAEKKIQIKRKVLTDKTKVNKQTCSMCNGTGRIVNVITRGPFTQKQVSHCMHCENGFVYSGGVSEQIDMITVNLHRGVKNGAHYRFHEKADYIYSLEKTTDLVIVIKEKPHSTYQRNGMDLITQMELNILHIISGNPLLYTHIDGKQYGLDVSNIKVFDKAYYIKFMGIRENEYQGGDLIVNFIPVVNMTDKNKRICRENLQVEKINDDIEIKSTFVYDKDRDTEKTYPSGQQNVQCAQQ